MRLNFCVRDGNRWIPHAIATGNLFGSFADPHNRIILIFKAFAFRNLTHLGLTYFSKPFDSSRSSPRHISIGQLNALLHLHLRPINLFVSKVSYFFRMGYLILRMVSHLDAFSDSPFRTWLPSHAPGGTTGAPSVRPHRSSRTRCRPSQISYAHDG